MKTSCKKETNRVQMKNKNQNLNFTPFTPRKQLKFTSQLQQKYNISCSKRKQDQENLKNNLLMTYIESQSYSPSSSENVLKFSAPKKKSPILLKHLQNENLKKNSNELIVSR